MYIFFNIFLIAAILGFLLGHFRRKKIAEKVCSMSLQEKVSLLNETIRPFGYQYLTCEDVFLSAYDAWQREFGYTRRYDCFAPWFNMVFDCRPICFHYKNRTWMIEFWKGQYGINTGAEIGIYCADTIVPQKKQKRHLFHTISDRDVPVFSMILYRSGKKIAGLSMPHWWLAVFRMGCFSRPEDLCTSLSVSFRERGMACAFADALADAGYRREEIKLCGSCVSFPFCSPGVPAGCSWLTRLIRIFTQMENRLFCRLFLAVTRPFGCTTDRLVFLYYYLPFCFRRCLRLHKTRKPLGGRKRGGKR